MKILDGLNTLILALILGLLVAVNFLGLGTGSSVKQSLLEEFFTSDSVTAKAGSYRTLALMDATGYIDDLIQKGLAGSDAAKQLAALEMQAATGSDAGLESLAKFAGSDNPALAKPAIKLMASYPNKKIKKKLLGIVKESQNAALQKTALKVIAEKKIKGLLDNLQKLEIKDEAVKSELETTIVAIGGKKKPVYNPEYDY